MQTDFKIKSKKNNKIRSSSQFRHARQHEYLDSQPDEICSRLEVQRQNKLMKNQEI